MLLAGEMTSVAVKVLPLLQNMQFDNVLEMVRANQGKGLT